jgi:4-amino-4-deoxy-L-arabinose transferase-like glycosyltransferase
VALLAHALLAAPLLVAWRGAAALLLLGLPGALLARVVFEDEREPLTQVVLGLCGALSLAALLLLALHALPGPLPWWLVLGVFDALSALLGLWLLSRPAPPKPAPWQQLQPHSFAVFVASHRIVIGRYLPLLLIALLGAGLRFAYLGGAELQGDEANVVLLGVDAVIGHDAILLLHRKGPVEVLLPTGIMALVGQINEWAARLPFALAGMGVILGAFVLARRMLSSGADAEGRGRLAGAVAATILALDGFLIAYSRMVQYQNVVALMMIGAMWCAWRFYEGAPSPRRYLAGAAVLAAIAGLAHYDGWAVLPALTWLALAGARRRGWRLRRCLGELAIPLAIYAGLLVSFYLPFVLHPQFRSTLNNLLKRTGQRDTLLDLFNNLPFYERVSTFYNTTYQIHWLGAALAAAMLVWLWRYGRPRALGWALAALLLLGCALLVWAPQRLALEGIGSWAVVAFVAPIAGLMLSPATPPALRALLLWFAAPFVANGFLIDDPKTHFYTMDAGAALLIGLAIEQLTRWLRERRLAVALAPLALGGAALVALAAPYAYLVFVRQSPEYRIVFPAARPAIYRASYGDTLPRDAGYFGFPHRAGWKVIGELYRQGTLQGSFESNEDYLMTLWYLGREPRCGRDPNYYFLSDAPMDLVKLPVEQIRKDYHLFGTVLVDGAKKIDIYSRLPTGAARSFEMADYGGVFDTRPVASRPARPMLFDLAPLGQTRGYWRRGLALQRADMRKITMAAGQSTTLVLHWAASAPLAGDEEVFVALVGGDGRPAVALAPQCASGPPSEWHTRADHTTSFALAADAGIPPGQYSVQVGLRDRATGAALPLDDGSTALTIATLRVSVR